MSVNYRRLKSTERICKEMSDERLMESISSRIEFAKDIKLSEENKVVIKKYVEYLGVEEYIRQQYEEIIDDIKQQTKTFEYVDAMYHMERMGQIIGLTDWHHKQTAETRTNTKLKISELTLKKKKMETKYPKLLLIGNRETTEKLLEDIIPSLYFDTLMTIKIIKNEIDLRRKSAQRDKDNNA